MESQHDVPTEPIIADVPAAKGKRYKQPPPTRPRRGNPLVALLLFILGIMLGILATLFFVLFVARDNARLPATVPTQTADITVQVGSTFLTQLVTRKLTTAGLPGNISNVHVTLTSADQIVVQGNDTFDLVFTSVTRPFTITMQTSVQSCQPHVHVLHADLGNIPVTTFATNYESQINQQIQPKGSDLPSGFTYCAISVRTAPEALYLTYSATAQ